MAGRWGPASEPGGGAGGGGGVLAGALRSASWQGEEGVGRRDFEIAEKRRASPASKLEPVAVRYRAILGEGEAGTVAVFPPPHAFFFPRDRTDNFSFAQVGTVD